MEFAEYEANWQWFGIATNGDYEGEELLRLYHGRGESENIIKEYKWDIGLRKFSSGDLHRNGIVFLFGAITQSLIRYFTLLYLPDGWKSLTVSSIRYRLKEASFVVLSSRYLILKFNPEYIYYNLWKRLEKLLN